MFHRIKTDVISWILLLSLFFLLVEFSTSGEGLVFPVFFLSGLIYWGKKRLPRTTGKILFFGGIFFLGMTLLNTVSFRFLLFALLAYGVVLLRQTKQKPLVMEPMLEEMKQNVIVTEPLLQNNLLAAQSTSSEPYQWKDINIQGVVGDKVIDLTNTVLPNEEVVIFIRNGIGNITIILPYELEAKVIHSSIAGKAKILSFQETGMWNQTLSVETREFQGAKQRVKILTSLVIGDLEVKQS